MSSKNDGLYENMLGLARIALTGRDQDIHLVIHRMSKKFKDSHPELSGELVRLLQEAPTRSTPLRKQADVPLPVDVDSRLQLLRVENTDLAHKLILSKEIEEGLNQVISERKSAKNLMDFGLHPTKSVLLTGPPGVGKTMAAKWMANCLNKPLLVLDLAAVMSSFLGRTGNNIRFVLDYAKNSDCVLLLDELDAIAKRRDDSSEIGELKRLVTVLLQEIDDWPPTGLLVAATNHPDLLDPAVWRRFEVVLKFENPTALKVGELVRVMLDGHVKEPEFWAAVLPHVFEMASFSEVERQIQLLRKNSIVQNKPLDVLLKELLLGIREWPRDRRVNVATALAANGVSQRQATEITGIARETIRKHQQNKKSDNDKA